ncbi:MAG: hypothetical protein LBM72_00310 [Mycoplasmataceae bacterium]|jgi:hypothetical protein|nr:hypothetical protein [Mycoplasmataceae bacterium]
MKKNDKLQSKPKINDQEIVIDYNRPMQPYQVRVEHRDGKDHLIVCAEKIGKHRMTVDELAIEMRAGFKSIRIEIKEINDRLDYNGLKPLPNNRPL